MLRVRPRTVRSRDESGDGFACQSSLSTTDQSNAGSAEARALSLHDGPISRRKRRYILTADQSDLDTRAGLPEAPLPRHEAVHPHPHTRQEVVVQRAQKWQQARAVAADQRRHPCSEPNWQRRRESGGDDDKQAEMM
eukprot:816473-Prorocentrum_minimum.AAC.1